MKTILYFLILITLFSCSSINKVLTINDPFKEETSIKLLQVLDGYSDERKSLIYDQDYYFPIKTIYTKSDANKSMVYFEFKLTTSARTEELDSTIYLQIDEDKFKLTSNNYAMRNYVSSSTSTSTETTTSSEGDDENKDSDEENVVTSTSTTTTTTEQTLQAMKHTFIIPQNLWRKIAYCDKILIRAYIENEGVDVMFRGTEKKQFKYFFKEVLKSEFTYRNMNDL